MTRGGLFAGTKCPYSASRVKSWTYLWVADAKPSATQYHPGGVVLITQPPRWLTTDLVCSYFGRESRVSLDYSVDPLPVVTQRPSSINLSALMPTLPAPKLRSWGLDELVYGFG